MTPSSAFPYESRFVDVLGSQMHYVEEGSGAPVVFLHGNPTSSYLWRNIVPFAARHGRAIAVDLIGMGKSGKPDLDYRFCDHVRYLDGFLETLGLEDITFVLHDWGSALGFHYARRREDSVRGLAFMEAIVRPADWSDGNLVERFLFRRMRHPEKGDRMNIDKNFFVERVLPMMIKRTLTPAERDAYREPFRNPASRRPVAQWPREIPFNGEGPEDVHRVVSDYRAWLETTRIPKLLLHADPGVVMKRHVVSELEAVLPELTSVGIGAGKHYVQEDQPVAIGRALERWLVGLAGPTR
jgi:haloalkane dehalogenase